MDQDDYSLINVVHHLKDGIQKTYGDNFLTLQYKWAKPTQPTEGNLKFQKIIQQSQHRTMIMNANKEMKKKPYVRLKSMTYEEELKWLEINLKFLHKTLPMNVEKNHKIDLNFQGNKVSFESETMKWSFKNKYLLFRPNYEAVKKGKLFRISLTSQFKGKSEPKRKVTDVLRDAISWAIQGRPQEKVVQKGKTQYKAGMKYNGGNPEKYQVNAEWPLRFKQQTTYELNKSVSIVMSKVYQVVNTKMYESILELVDNKKNSHSQTVGKLLLTELVTDVFEEFKKDLSYEVQMRFSPQLVEDLEDMYNQEIEQIMQKTGSIFVNLFRDPHEFSSEDIVDDLKSL